MNLCFQPSSTFWDNSKTLEKTSICHLTTWSILITLEAVFLPETHWKHSGDPKASLPLGSRMFVIDDLDLTHDSNNQAKNWVSLISFCSPSELFCPSSAFLALWVWAGTCLTFWPTGNTCSMTSNWVGHFHIMWPYFGHSYTCCLLVDSAFCMDVTKNSMLSSKGNFTSNLEWINILKCKLKQVNLMHTWCSFASFMSARANQAL